MRTHPFLYIYTNRIGNKSIVDQTDIDHRVVADCK
jgi:hypothetical protein